MELIKQRFYADIHIAIIYLKIIEINSKIMIKYDLIMFMIFDSVNMHK